MSYLVKEKWNQLFLQFEKTLQIFFKMVKGIVLRLEK